MPRSPINLRDPRVVIFVAALLLIVGAVNLQTFLPLLRRGGSDTAWDPDVFIPPADTAELTRVAAGHVAGAGAPAPAIPAAAGADLGGGLRDPFQTGRAAVSTPVAASAASSAAPVLRPVPARRGPVCTAVLFTGAQPAAVIDGETRRVGDRLGDWRISVIGPDGVHLQGRNGEMFLAVGARGDGAIRYSLVTNSATTPADDSTTLDPQPGSREP